MKSKVLRILKALTPGFLRRILKSLLSVEQNDLSAAPACTIVMPQSYPGDAVQTKEFKEFLQSISDEYVTAVRLCYKSLSENLASSSKYEAFDYAALQAKISKELSNELRNEHQRVFLTSLLDHLNLLQTFPESYIYEKLKSWTADLDLANTSKPLRLLELAAGRGDLSALAAAYGHEVVCSDVDCYYGNGATNWIREVGSGFRNSVYFAYLPEAVRNFAGYARESFDIIAINGFHLVDHYARAYARVFDRSEIQVLAEHIQYFLPLLRSAGILQMRASLMFPGDNDSEVRVEKIRQVGRILEDSGQIQLLSCGLDAFPHSRDSNFNIALVLRKL